jgi:hypothetical protein
VAIGIGVRVGVGIDVTIVDDDVVLGTWLSVLVKPVQLQEQVWYCPGTCKPSPTNLQ